MTQPPILIAGAGLASLLLGRVLLRYKIPFEIFERDASPVFRGQGYRLRLSDEGLAAIEEALGQDYGAFYEMCGKTKGSGPGEYDAITGDKQADFNSISTKSGITVGVGRGEMRAFFMRGLEDHIHWSKRVKTYEESEDGVRLHFADGSTSEVGSMLIGGEGVTSVIAKQVSGGLLKVFDTGARGIHGQAPTSAFKQMGEGVFAIHDNSRGEDSPIFAITNVRAQDKDDPDHVFGWTLGGGPGVVAAPNDDYSIIGEKAARLAKELTKGWSEKFRPIFENMIEGDAAFWKITCSEPKGVPVWPNNPRVTVIGDAAHSMTPAGGIGANTALRDSALLGKLIGEAGGFRGDVTEEYEKKMRVYGSEAVAQSYGMAKKQWKLGELKDELQGPRSGIEEK